MEQFNAVFQKIGSYKALLFCFGISLSFSFFISLFPSGDKLNEESPDTGGIDTFVPPGFVLVPINLENSEFLDSLVGDFGRIDLFVRGGPNLTQLERIATKIRLIRAPKNPNVFGVLAPHDLAPQIVKHPGPFLAVVQNPEQIGTSIEISPKENASQTVRPKKRKVIYDPEVEI